MIDFICAIKYNCKDRINFQNCSEPIFCEYWEKRRLEGCRGVDVLYNPQNRTLKVEGSLGYFLKGQNYSLLKDEFIEGVDYISDALRVGLWDAEVQQFENGLILPVDKPPKCYIANHSPLPKSGLNVRYNSGYRGKSILWYDKAVDLKMYDVNANFKKKLSKEERESAELDGWKPQVNHLKFEVRYKKPDMLNGGRVVLLEKLQSEPFEELLKQSIMEQYQRLAPTSTLVHPKSKKDYQCIDVVLRMLAEEVGLSIGELKGRMYERINQENCLTKADKDARKAQIRSHLAKLEFSPNSEWDLGKQLKVALDE